MRVNLNRKDVLSILSEDDVKAWFGHELAHIVEYEQMSNPKLFLFAFRYIFDVKFRFSVEKRVNTFAVNHGFAEELFSIWKKFLSSEKINKKYKKYIVKNYRPHWEGIKEISLKHGISEQMYESLR